MFSLRSSRLKVPEKQQKRLSLPIEQSNLVANPYIGLLQEQQEITQETSVKLFEELRKNTSSCTLLLLGRTGVGKSSTINTIFGLDTPVHDSESCTTKPTTYERTVSGISLSIIDTPGWMDSRGELVDRKNVQQIQKYLLGREIHGVILVEKLTETRFDKAQQEMVVLYTKHFGKSLWKNALVVLTFANSPLPDSAYNFFDEGDNVGPFRNFVSKKTDMYNSIFSKYDRKVQVFPIDNSRRCARNEEGQRVLVDGTAALPNLINGLIQVVDTATAFLFLGHLQDNKKPVVGHEGDESDRQKAVKSHSTVILNMFIKWTRDIGDLNTVMGLSPSSFPKSSKRD